MNKKNVRVCMKTDLKRAVVSVPFLLSVLGMLLLIAVSSWDMLLAQINAGGTFPPMFHQNLIHFSVNTSFFSMACPVFCTIPYAVSFVDEYKSGYLKTCLIRTDKGAYIQSKVVSVGLSGGLCLFAAVMLALVISALIFTPMESKAEYVQNFLFTPLFAQSLRIFAFGVLFSLIGACLACALMSKYMAYISPFILFYLLIIIHERYLPTVYVINPQEWIQKYSPWPVDGWGLWLFLLGLIILFALLFVLIIRKSIETL